MNQNEGQGKVEPDPEEVSAIERWIDEGNPNVWDPQKGWKERRVKEKIDPAPAE